MIAECSLISSFVQISINLFVYLTFIVYVFQNKLRFRKKMSALLIGGYSIASLAMILLYLLKNSPFRTHHWLMLALWVGGTVLTAVLLLRSNLLQLLFLVFTVLSVQFSTMEVTKIFYHFGVGSWMFRSRDVYIVFLQVIVLVAFLPPMWYLFVTLFKRVVDMEVNRNYWNYLYIVPMIFYLYCLFSAFNYPLETQNNTAVSMIMLFLLNSFSYLAYVAVLKMLIKTHDSLLATEKAGMMQQQFVIQQEQYKKLTDDHNQVQRLRHDIRHHFIVLKAYAEKEDLKNVNAYLDTCIGHELLHEEAPICTNRSLDLILRHYIARAKSQNIKVKASIHLPVETRVSDTELCIVFGNLVENAVESCERQKIGDRFITIKAKVIHEGLLGVTVTNSYEGKIHQIGENFVSSKHDGIGIGTCSVRNIVETKGGSCKLSFADNVFKASILLVP